MRLRTDFLIPIRQYQSPPANDNHSGDLDFIIRNGVVSELTLTLATIARDEGAP
jgi:hypothetical protein